MVGITLLFLYRYLTLRIGIKELGAWSIATAVVSIPNVASLGMPMGLTRTVAKYKARGQLDVAARAVAVASVFILLAMSVALVLWYPAAQWILRDVLGIVSPFSSAPGIPVLLVATWVSSLASIPLATLDGLQFITARSIVVALASFVLLLSCIWLVPRWGCVGLAVSCLVQSSVTLALSLTLVCGRLRPSSSTLGPGKRGLFSEMIAVGAQTQLAYFSLLLQDPVTKALLSRYGGLPITALYEMAARVTAQVRAVLVSANNVLVPVAASLQEQRPALLTTAYLKSYRATLATGAAGFGLLLSSLPFLSTLLLSDYKPEFIWLGAGIATAMFVNTICAPAYFVNVGIGALRANTIGHVVIGVLTPLLAWSLGLWLGSVGVVVGSMTALCVGSLIIILMFHATHGIPLANLAPKDCIGVLLSCIFCIAITSSACFYATAGKRSWMLFAGTAALCLFALSIPLAGHPSVREAYLALRADPSDSERGIPQKADQIPVRDLGPLD